MIGGAEWVFQVRNLSSEYEERKGNKQRQIWGTRDDRYYELDKIHEIL